jgi:hypothetical protein
MPSSMHDLREKRCGNEMEMRLVLSECLRVLYAGFIFNTRERFKDLSGTGREIRERAGSRAIDGMALVWRYCG